jgi:hypothetical protein
MMDSRYLDPTGMWKFDIPADRPSLEPTDRDWNDFDGDGG